MSGSVMVVSLLLEARLNDRLRLRPDWCSCCVERLLLETRGG